MRQGYLLCQTRDAAAHLVAHRNAVTASQPERIPVMVLQMDQGVELHLTRRVREVEEGGRHQHATIFGEDGLEQNCPAVGEAAQEGLYGSGRPPCKIQKKACMLPNHDDFFGHSWLLRA